MTKSEGQNNQGKVYEKVESVHLQTRSLDINPALTEAMLREEPYASRGRVRFHWGVEGACTSSPLCRKRLTAAFIFRPHLMICEKTVR